MLLVDDILAFPVTGVLWVFREVCKAAQQELDNEADAITVELRELYLMLEGGKITEQEFEAREKTLLDRLDRIEAGKTDPDAETEEESEEQAEPDLEYSQP